MKNEEKTKWKPGDVAICVHVGPLTPANLGTPPPLRLNLEYPVHAVRECECGNVQLDVGLYSESPNGTFCQCGSMARPGTHIHWANATRFVKKKTKEELQEEIAVAIDEENFELAHKLDEQLRNN